MNPWAPVGVPSYPRDDPEVYPPSEDTYIMLDGLAMDLDTIKNKKASFILEVGPGNGVLLAKLMRWLGWTGLTDCRDTSNKDQIKTRAFYKTPAVTMHCMDINKRALQYTQETGTLNYISKCTFGCIEGDALHSCFQRPIYDIVYWNPPYVPSDDCEMTMNSATTSDERYNATYAGGNDGSVIISKFITSSVDHLLAPGGYLYILLEARNKLPAVERLAQECGIFKEDSWTLIYTEKCLGEKLTLVRLQKKS